MTTTPQPRRGVPASQKASVVSTPQDPRSNAGAILSSLPPPFRTALLSMYDGEPQLGSDGERHSLDGITAISPGQGMWLYNLCREAKPRTTIEIGMAYGYSTMYFLAAIRENGLGHHTAIDPFQKCEKWHGIGWRHVQSLGMNDGFRFVEEKSVSALVHLADQAETFEVIFVDGNHRFDDVFVDFTLSAELCPMGGYIILDDMWMPSIRRAAEFIRLNRIDFKQVRTPESNIAVFRRIGEDSRDWQHYIEFFDRDFPRHTRFLKRGVRAVARLLRRQR